MTVRPPELELLLSPGAASLPPEAVLVPPELGVPPELLPEEPELPPEAPELPPVELPLDEEEEEPPPVPPELPVVPFAPAQTSVAPSRHSSTVVTVLLTVLPLLLTAAKIPTPTRAAIRPYSIADAPELSLQRFLIFLS
tara:strand:+ start:1003 stop:1419 length:417 start_codon:yes stop_codon:yes gene_type:complete